MNPNVFNVHQDQYVRSKINPISREMEHKNIHFNTKYRKDYYKSSSTNFQYDFPEPCNNVVSLKLSSICIPNSFYLFSSQKGNNRFIVEENVSGSLNKVHEVVIPDGNYTAPQLETYLNDTYFYNSSHPSLSLRKIYFSIDTHSLKTTFDISGVPPVETVNIKFVNNRNADNVMNTAGWIMGFRYGQYLNIGGSGRPSFLTSEGIYNVNEDCSFFFCVDDHNRNVNNPNIVFFQDSTMRNDVLAKIHLVDGKFTLENNIINDDGDNFTKTRKFYGPVDIQKIHVRLIDQYGRLVDLNNMDFTFSLELNQLYNNI